LRNTTQTVQTWIEHGNAWGGDDVSSEFARPVTRARERRRPAPAPRLLAIEAIGPLTIVAGVVWAIAQPYRVAFIYRDGKGLYDYFFQPPLLVVAAGVVFALLVAPSLARDLEDDERASS
jgi:hypothetical protein